MKNLLIAFMAAWLTLFAAVASADQPALDDARIGYIAAQKQFVDSMGMPGATVSGHRNFTRYLARIQSSKKNLDQAKGAYDAELEKMLKENPRFDDWDYAEQPDLKGAMANFEAIRQEVGDSAFAEAAAAYADEFK